MTKEQIHEIHLLEQRHEIYDLNPDSPENVLPYGHMEDGVYVDGCVGSLYHLTKEV